VDGLAAADWVVMTAYGVVVLGIGWWANRRQESGEDYFLGGRKLPWWAVGASLIATSLSAATLIGVTGLGFTTGMAYLHLQLGDLLAISFVAIVFLPFFSRLRLTTAYEYLERRFGPWARTVASLLFIGQTLLRAAILVYAPALALATILGWSVTTAIVVTAAAAIVYSAFGGIAAVVWTDCVQLLVIGVAVTYCLVLIGTDVPGGLGAVLDHAGASGHLEAISFEPRRDQLFNVLGAVVPYGVLALSLFGTGQQAVQRFLACEDLRAARRAACLGWGVGAVATAACLFLGVALAAWADLAPGASTLGTKGDDVVPAFVVARLPAGFAGLMLAAIFAASMSSIDSAIHSLSTCTIVDFVNRFRREPLSDRAQLMAARLATVVFGVVAVCGALVAAADGEQMVKLLLRWLGYAAGPLLGLFLLGLLTRRTSEKGALIGMAVAIAVIVAIVLSETGTGPWHVLWLAPLSCTITIVVAWLTSLGFPAPERSRLDGLTWARRDHGEAAGTRSPTQRP